MSHTAVLRGGLLTVLAMAALVGCGEADKPPTATDDDARSQVTGAPPEVDPQRVIAAWEGLIVDFTPVDEPQDIADKADLVVTGTVKGFRPGRITGVKSMDEPLAFRSAAIEIEVTSVSKGSVKAGDTVFVEVTTSAQQLTAAIPQNLPVAAYLVPATESTPDYPFETDGSGLPEDAQLWTTAHPQGLIFGYDREEGTVAPVAGLVERTDTVEESVP